MRTFLNNIFPDIVQLTYAERQYFMHQLEIDNFTYYAHCIIIE